MSISENVGGSVQVFKRTRTEHTRFKKNIVELLERVPLVENAVIDKLKGTKDSITGCLFRNVFENMGITWVLWTANIPFLCKVLKEEARN